MNDKKDENTPFEEENKNKEEEENSEENTYFEEEEENSEENENSEEETAKKLSDINKNTKIKNTKIFLVLSFFVPFLIMGVMFARAGVYPFGDRQVMFSDCKQQYLPFLKEFQTKLQNGDSLFYSWRNGFGTNFLAMIGYYIASPLNFLTFFIPVKYVREAMAVFMMIKIGCASLFTAIYLKHVYHRNDLSLVAFGSCYSFCAFMLGYYWNVIWLDSVALLPLIALGVYCVIYEKKYKLYIISLAIAFFSSYYIGYMICLFVALWFIVVTINKKFELVEFCENILKMALYSALALMMTLPLTLPACIQLQYTVGTDDAFPEKLEIYNNFAELTANLFSFVEPTSMEGLPNIASGVICILLMAVYVRSKEIPLREKIANLSLLGFLYISLNINVLDYIWHAFHFPNLIPYRFSFLFSFVMISIAYRAFSVFVELDKKDIIGMCLLTIIMVCISVFYLEKKAVIGSLIVACLYIIFMTLYEMDMLDRRLLTFFTSLVIVAEMCVQCGVGVHTVGTTSHDNYPENEEEVQELVKFADDVNPNDFYRIEQTDYSTKNDGMIYGYNGIGQFSSTSYKSIINFTNDFGIVSKRSSYQYLLTSPIASMLFDVKYMIARDYYSADDITLVKYKPSNNNKVMMYYNKYCLPLGYMTNKQINNVNLENDSAFVTQNKVVRAATGIKKDVYTVITPYLFNCQNMTYKKEKGKVYSYSYSSSKYKQGTIDVTYKAPKDGMLYAWANIHASDEIKAVSDHLSHTYYVDAQRYIFPIGYYHEGETVKLVVDAKQEGTNKIVVAYLNDDVLEQAYNNLSDEGLKVEKYTSTSVVGTITAKTDGTFFTSIPYEKGWKLFIDGKPAETKDVMNTFMAADIAKGTHKVEMYYTPEGFISGLILGVMGLGGFIGLCVWDSKRKNNKNNKEKAAV